MNPENDLPRAPAGAEALDRTGSRYLPLRQVTVDLAAPLSAEDCTVQSMPDASPVKWHLAHTNWFFENFVLVPGSPGYRAFDPAFRVLFNSYYNAVGDKHPRPERGMISRPGLEEILAYRSHVDAAMLEVLADLGLRDAVGALVELGLHHEQQHQELILTDLKHMLSRNPLKPVYRKQWPLTPIRARAASWIGFDGGVHEIGHAGPGFCFDNELPRHRLDRSVPDRLAPGDPRGLHRLHRRRRLSALRTLAFVRMGHGVCSRVAGPDVLGAARWRLVHVHPAKVAVLRTAPRTRWQLNRGP